MHLLFDLNHPAHVHLFKHVIWELERRGHEITITARDKDVTTQLLDAYGFDYTKTSKQRIGFLGMLSETLAMDWKVLRAAQRQKLDLLIGTSVAAAHASFINIARSVIFNEDDRVANSLFPKITYPFADYIVTPKVLPGRFGNKHVRYDGNQELAYLHPNWFTPNSVVLDELGIGADEDFFVLRFVGLQASHDTQAKGLDRIARRALVERLARAGRVIITSERPLPEEFEDYRMSVSPEKMHDLLYFAKLFVGDSQSMTAEAAILGTPAVRCNNFVGRISYLQELEEVYGLAFGFLPDEHTAMMVQIDTLLETPNLKKSWQKRRNKFIKDKVDVTAWIIDFIEGLEK